MDPERVANTWRLPLQKIVISRWLQKLVADVGESATYIPNGLDFDDFGVDVPPSEREPQRLLMLHHEQPLKGSRDGLEAMRLTRRQIPQLSGTIFGVPAKPKGLPPWISYQQKPVGRPLRKLYNEAAIFVAPSWAEGFGLPPAEAMQCGAALCATDIGGYREYAIHNQTALLSPPKNPESLASNITNLVRNNLLRLRLAEQGHEYIQRFTWERAVSALERLFADTA